jgi:hypothetical protein
LDPSKPDRTDSADTDALHASSATGFLNRVRWFDSGRGHSRYEGKEKGLDEREKVLAGRAKELEEREAALNLREAQLEAEFEVREQRLEQREKAGAELEADGALGRESDLSIYVAQLQENFDRRESEWWSKQPGKDVGQSPAA